MAARRRSGGLGRPASLYFCAIGHPRRSDRVRRGPCGLQAADCERRQRDARRQLRFRPGDLFPVGQTTVTCTATDVVTDETASASFQVQVLPKAQEEAASSNVRRSLLQEDDRLSQLRDIRDLNLAVLHSGTIAFMGHATRVHEFPSSIPAGYGERRSVGRLVTWTVTRDQGYATTCSGGAHCCFWTNVYHYNGAESSIIRMRGAIQLQLVDLIATGDQASQRR